MSHLSLPIGFFCCFFFTGDVKQVVSCSITALSLTTLYLRERSRSARIHVCLLFRQRLGRHPKDAGVSDPAERLPKNDVSEVLHGNDAAGVAFCRVSAPCGQILLGFYMILHRFSCAEPSQDVYAIPNSFPNLSPFGKLSLVKVLL